MADSIEKIADEVATYQAPPNGQYIQVHPRVMRDWESRLRALSPDGGGEWAEKARQMIVELRDYVVNKRDAQVLPRKRAGYQRELDKIDALLAASPQQEPGTVREMSQADCPHKGAYSYRDGWATGWNDCRAAMLAASPQQEPGAKAKPTYQDLIDYVTDNPSGQTLAGASGDDAAMAYIRDWCPDHVKEYVAKLTASPPVRP